MDHFYNASHMGEDWFTYPGLYKAVAENLPNNSHIVEVGSWKGKSAAFMCVELINLNKSIQFDCIDTWEGSAENSESQSVINGTLYEEFIHNMKPVERYYTPLRMPSLEAAKIYQDKSLEFVFIDAAHDYDNVKADILAWAPKIKPGCVLAGHDYGWSPDVQRAVKEVFGDRDYSDPWGGGCWILNI